MNNYFLIGDMPKPQLNLPVPDQVYRSGLADNASILQKRSATECEGTSIWILDFGADTIGDVPLRDFDYEDMDNVDREDLPEVIKFIQRIRGSYENDIVILLAKKPSLVFIQECMAAGASWVWDTTKDAARLEGVIEYLIRTNRPLVRVLVVDNDGYIPGDIREWLPTDEFQTFSVNTNATMPNADISVQDCLRAYEKHSPIDVVVMDMALSSDSQKLFDNLRSTVMEYEFAENARSSLEGIKAIEAIVEHHDAGDVRFLIYSNYAEQELMPVLQPLFDKLGNKRLRVFKKDRDSDAFVSEMRGMANV